MQKFSKIFLIIFLTSIINSSLFAYKTLDDAINNFGSIYEIYQGKNSKYKIYCIQDAHCNKEAQQNIFNILKILKNIHKQHIKVIGVEGSCGEISTDIIRYIPNKKLKSSIVDNLLDKGYITGAEMFQTFSKEPIILYGLENNGLYNENFVALYDSLQDKTQMKKLIEKLEYILNKKKKKNLSKQLLSIDKKHNRYLKGKISFSKFTNYLTDYAAKLNINMNEFPNISSYIIAKETRTLGYKYNRIKLIEEQEKLFYLIKLTLAKENTTMKKYVYAERHLYLLKNYINNNLSEYEILEYEKQKDQFYKILEDIGVYTRMPSREKKLLETNYNTMKTFYDLAKKRNEYLVKNLLTELDKKHTRIGVMIFGGFHTTGITEILRAQGISYTVFAPKMENADKDLYLERIKEQAKEKNYNNRD